MHRLQLIFASIVIFFTFAFWFVKMHTVSFTDRNLASIGLRLDYKGQPFSGFAYELYSKWSLYRIAPVWNGQRLWKEIHWYPDGQRWVERDFTNGLPDGTFKTWHTNGRPHTLTQYKNGVTDGEYWSWNKRGDVVEYRLSKNGEEVAYKAFTFDKKTYYNYIYRDGERVGVQAGEFCKSKRKPAEE